MADPYEVLGLAPDASLDEAEEAYHHRLLRCHPDLHASEGREAVARAEAQTRELNDAIHEIRHGYRPPRPTSSRARAGSGSGAGFGARPRSAPWPGTADRGQDHPPVPCPFCGRSVTSLSEFEAHLAQAHPAQDRSRQRAARRHARAQRWWWPVPLWLFAFIDAVVVGLTIAVVAAIGGHRAVVEAVLGDDAPRECVPGTHVPGRFGGHTCDPDGWPAGYVMVGVLVFIAFVVYRWTTSRQDR